jgi:hypothetical protein
LIQGRLKEPSVGPQIIPRKEKLVKVDKLDFSLMKMNPILINGERTFIKWPGSCCRGNQDDDNTQAEDQPYAQTPQPGLYLLESRENNPG